MDNIEKVSIVIPCRNEEKFIRQCIISLISNDYPKEQLEIFIIDGMSDDNTCEILKPYLNKYTFIKILKNHKKYTPSGMNIGIEESKGDVIIILGAHSKCPNNFISNAIKLLKTTGADVVGGPLNTLPPVDNIIANSISLATSHPFGVGNSKFRISKHEGFVNTVPYGAYKRSVFQKVGKFNERLIRNQDNELNSRIIKSGGKIFQSPLLTVDYFNQSTILGLMKQALKTGMWNVITIKANKNAFTLRHFVPFFFVASIIVTYILGVIYPTSKLLTFWIIALYTFLAMVFSFQISLGKGIMYLFLLPIIFFIYHLSYGLGSIVGLLTFQNINK